MIQLPSAIDQSADKNAIQCKLDFIWSNYKIKLNSCLSVNWIEMAASANNGNRLFPIVCIDRMVNE